MKTDEKIVSLLLLTVCVLCRRLTTTTDATYIGDGFELSMSECLLCMYLYVCWFGESLNPGGGSVVMRVA